MHERKTNAPPRPHNLADPASPASFFDPGKPLEVDIGCGKGRFLFARAAAHPETNFLGVDRQIGRLRRADVKVVGGALQNVRFLNVEAYDAVRNLLPPGSVTCFYVFFPDPWPKRRHHRRRLFSPEFIDAAHTALKPGGLLHVATDHVDYAEQITRLFDVDCRFERTLPFEPASDDERTDFEILFAKAQTPAIRRAFRRKP